VGGDVHTQRPVPLGTSRPAAGCATQFVPASRSTTSKDTVSPGSTVNALTRLEEIVLWHKTGIPVETVEGGLAERATETTMNVSQVKAKRLMKGRSLKLGVIVVPY
jgi:hypothetical protein